MRKLITNIYRLYADGFRGMTVGKTLWTIIIIKLLLIFLVLKLFFFPDYIGDNTSKGEEPDFVSTQLQQRVVDNNQQDLHNDIKDK